MAQQFFQFHEMPISVFRRWWNDASSRYGYTVHIYQLGRCTLCTSCRNRRVATCTMAGRTAKEGMTEKSSWPSNRNFSSDVSVCEISAPTEKRDYSILYMFMSMKAFWVHHCMFLYDTVYVVSTYTSKSIEYDVSIGEAVSSWHFITAFFISYIYIQPVGSIVFAEKMYEPLSETFCTTIAPTSEGTNT